MICSGECRFRFVTGLPVQLLGSRDSHGVWIIGEAGQESIARAMRRYLETGEVGAFYIAPGAP